PMCGQFCGMTERLVVGPGVSRVVVAAVARHARLTTSSAARDWTALSHLSRRRTDRLLMAGGVASTALLAGYAKRYGCRPPRARPAVGRPGALGNRHREIGPQLVFFAAGVARHPDRCAIAHRIPADPAVSAALRPTRRTHARGLCGDGDLLDRGDDRAGLAGGHAPVAVPPTPPQPVGVGAHRLTIAGLTCWAWRWLGSLWWWSTYGRGAAR